MCGKVIVMGIDTNEKKIEDILTRGVGEFIDPEGKFKEKLLKNPKDIVIKFGVDPTRPDIHLGHAVVLWKLRKFQDLGCKVVFLVGDFTARIGDPTGKDKIRPEIEFSEIQKNVESFIDHIDKILKVEKKDSKLNLQSSIFSWIRNSDWFYGITDFTFPEVTVYEKYLSKEGVSSSTFVGKAVLYQKGRMQLKDLDIKKNIQGITLHTLFFTLQHITFDRLRKRDMFEKRIAEEKPLYMNEMLYPVLQGIDSLVLSKIYGSCDLEIGGTDQTFNMLMGRDVMTASNKEPQSVLTLKILEGTDGKEKMSKSLDNYVAITDTPTDMFGKVMSIPDTSIINYFELCTPLSLDDIKKREKNLKDKKTNPRDVKMELARIIVELYHGKETAEKAQDNFISTFKEGGVSEDATEVTIKKETSLYNVVKNEVSSKTELRRLVKEGAVSIIGGEKINDFNFIIDKDITLKIGKHRFVKVKISK